MRKICAKIVPTLFTSELRRQCCIAWKALVESAKYKLVLRGQHLGDMAMITAESTMLLKGLKEDNFQGLCNQWKQRWDKCIASEGDKNDVPDNT
jgi:hypothetical protein